MPKPNPFNIQEMLTGAFTENTKFDKETNSISNVCMLKQESLNNRFYSEKALSSLVKLGKEAPVKSFIDHAMWEGQSVLKLLGEFSNLRKHKGAVYGDLSILEKSEAKEMIFDIAENAPHLAGFSISARGEFEEEPDNKGREVVKELVAIRSCDLVGEPATTNSLWEQQNKDSAWHEYKDFKDVWTNEYVNKLPDHCFAWIEDGGVVENDITTPHSLRHLPYRDIEGEIVEDQLGNARAYVGKVKNMPVEVREQVKEKLKTIAIGDKNKKPTNKGGDSYMEKLLSYFSNKIAKFSTLTEEAKEGAIMEFVDSKIEASDKASELSKEVQKLGKEKEDSEKKLAVSEDALKEAEAKVDAYETKTAKEIARKERIELISKITKEEELSSDDMSEQFKEILSEIQARGDVSAEDRIRELVKDRKTLLTSSGVTDAGHEQENVDEDKDKDKKLTPEELKEAEDKFNRDMNENL